ncbi:RNA polymerase sigma factor [Hanstruepera flava]|uniref:RNA polymerase sigma factor n=1 Tax=Hanstruepera flava TaxID=2930218 RepID=UPI002028B117|nr:RNA polymerase sigma factor [Hanstruepera flava]
MTLTTKNIEELVELCRARNQFAQLEVYNRYYKAMYNVAFRIVKDSFEAEDVMQDAFLTAFSKLDSLKDTVTFGSWLKRIVINNSIYRFNKNSKYQNVPFEHVMHKVEDDVHQGLDSDTSSSSDKAKLVLNTLNQLKDNYRIALTLHLIEGYDYEEIGDIMNLSYANCRTTISRAKESLRKKLKPIVNY